MNETTDLFIANFMGAKKSNYFDGTYGLILKGHGVLRNGVKDLKYHKSFDWLIDVLNHIKELGYDYNYFSKTNYFVIYKQNEKDYEVCVIGEQDKDMLTAYYTAIVKFIEWYNKNKKE